MSGHNPPGFTGHFERLSIFEPVIGIGQLRDTATIAAKARFIGVDLFRVPT